MKKALLVLCMGLAFAEAVEANSVNVALNATVTLNGTFGGDMTQYGWGNHPLANPQTLTNGVFLPEQTQWNIGSVFWSTASNSNAVSNYIDITLNGTYSITGFKIQADDNDNYLIQYNNGSTWQTAWAVPPPGGWGLTTSSALLSSPITTDELRISETGGDGFYAVSQVQAFAATPIPAAIWMVGSALAGLIGFGRRKLSA